MSKNSPLNFGMMGASGLTMAQRVQNAQNAPGGLAGNMNNMFMYGGGYAQLQQQQQMMNMQMQGMQNTQNQPQVAASSSYQDPNNTSAVGFDNAADEMNLPTQNNFNTVPITTGGLTPQVQNSAQGMFGTSSSRQRSVNKQPLITL